MGVTESRCCTNTAENKSFEKNEGTDVGRQESRATPAKALTYDPRSPSQSIDRTPIEIVATPAANHKPLVGVQPLPESNIRKRNVANDAAPLNTSSFVTDPRSPSVPESRTPICIQSAASGKNVAAVFDPRSPSQGVIRTPLLVKESGEVFHGEGIAEDKDALVICETPRKTENFYEELNLSYSSEVDLKECPFDPRSPSQDIERTPLAALEKPEHQTEVVCSRNLHDPRSPSTEVSRTPLTAMFSGHRELRRTVLMTNALMASPLSKKITHVATAPMQAEKGNLETAAKELDGEKAKLAIATEGPDDEIPAVLHCSFDSNNLNSSSMVASIGSEVDCISLDNSFEEDQASLNTIDTIEIDLMESHLKGPTQPLTEESVTTISDDVSQTCNDAHDKNGLNSLAIAYEKESDTCGDTGNAPLITKDLSPTTEEALGQQSTSELMDHPGSQQKISDSIDMLLHADHLQEANGKKPVNEKKDQPMQRCPMSYGRDVAQIQDDDIDIQMAGVLNDLVAMSCDVQVFEDVEELSCGMKEIVDDEQKIYVASAASFESVVNEENVFSSGPVQCVIGLDGTGKWNVESNVNRGREISSAMQVGAKSEEGRALENLDNFNKGNEKAIISEPCQMSGEEIPTAAPPAAEIVEVINPSSMREVEKVTAPKAAARKPKRKLKVPMTVTRHKNENQSPAGSDNTSNSGHIGYLRRPKSKSAEENRNTPNQLGEGSRRPMKTQLSRKSGSKLGGPNVVRSPLTVLTNEANSDKGQVARSPSKNQRATKLPRYQVTPPVAVARSISLSSIGRPAARSKSVGSGQRSLNYNKEN